MDKIKKNKNIFIVLTVICFIIGYFKVRDYYILKDCFVFSKDNIVRVLNYDKDLNSHNYHISEEDINYLSKVLSNSKLKKSSAKESPFPSMGGMLIFLDGNIRENKDGTQMEYKRSIELIKINSEKVYLILQINKLRDDDSFNMDGVAQKFYTINSKELVQFIEKLNSN
ncbi:hypothetical protein [Faecalimicrobium sp. JNUCC 81]